MKEQDNTSFKERLQSRLFEGRLLQSPDIDQKWEEMAPDYYGDAIKEFNAYPEVVLAWAAYLGAAVAFCWDKDWTGYKDRGYSFYCGEKGFDYMDEHIAREIVGYPEGSEEEASLAETMRRLAGDAYSFLRHEGLEPGSIDAYKAVLTAISVMYSVGAALMLRRLGYKLEAIG